MVERASLKTWLGLMGFFGVVALALFGVIAALTGEWNVAFIDLALVAVFVANRMTASS